MSAHENLISVRSGPTTTYQFHPTLWGDHFLSDVSDTNNVNLSTLQQYEELKEEMRNILLHVMDYPSKHLLLIDGIQRLAVDYHSKIEIDSAIKKLNHDFDSEENDLNVAALKFRLLRQHGCHVSCDVFEKFKDARGNFKQSLTNDVKGMLSLYEASYLGIHGEDIMDEAMAFTTSNLRTILSTNNMKHSLREQIKHALNRPIRKCFQRLEARHFIDFYSNEESHNATLLKFAKLDFNILQKQQQEELKELTKWWKKLDVPTTFPYARDRFVECYFWMSGINFEPSYSLGRNITTKIMALTSLIDDTYDNYANYEDLQLLTKAIHKWDIREIGVLPDYMKKLCNTLFDTYKEIEEELAKEGRSNCVNYAIEAMKKLVQSYHDEAKWRSEDYVPKIEEYMKVALVSCGYQMIETHCLLGMGNIATKEVFEWVSTIPKMVNASCVINRLMDDIVSPKYEKQRNHVATGIECYTTQHGVEEEEAVQVFQREIVNAWKDINEECLQQKTIPSSFLKSILNFARAMDVIYKDDDGYANSHVLKHLVSSLLNDPIDLISWN